MDSARKLKVALVSFRKFRKTLQTIQHFQHSWFFETIYKADQVLIMENYFSMLFLNLTWISKLPKWFWLLSTWFSQALGPLNTIFLMIAQTLPILLFCQPNDCQPVYQLITKFENSWVMYTSEKLTESYCMWCSKNRHRKTPPKTPTVLLRQHQVIYF